MPITEPRRLYQQLAAELKDRIEQGVYLVGDKLPAERFIADEKNVSRTVVREAIIMLAVEGYVEVRKGSGIYVLAMPGDRQQQEGSQKSLYGPKPWAHRASPLIATSALGHIPDAPRASGNYRTITAGAYIAKLRAWMHSSKRAAQDARTLSDQEPGGGLRR